MDKENYMKPHAFEGSLLACLKCFKKAGDPVHFIPLLVEYNEPPITLYNGLGRPIEPTCPGHKCPKCSRTWQHSYTCGQSDSHGLCLDCAQQAAADINRPKHIEESITKTTQHTPLEAKTLSITHEEFVVKNITHNWETGELNPNWQADLATHISQLERIIEQCKIKISSAHKARAAQEVQDLNKISPEEREQFLRDAARMRSAKKPREEKELKEPKEKTPATGSKRENYILSMLKMLNKRDTPDNRRYVTHDMLGED